MLQILQRQNLGIHVTEYSRENPNKSRQRFADAVVLNSAPDWSKKLFNFGNVTETPFKCVLQTLKDARPCQTESSKSFNATRTSLRSCSKEEFKAVSISTANNFCKIRIPAIVATI